MSHDVSSRSPAGSAGGVLEAVATHIREQATAYCESSRVPGYLAGVYYDGDQTGSSELTVVGPCRAAAC